MSITYNWKNKKLKQDDFGVATELVLAMEGTKDGITHKALMDVSFGGSDLKDYSDWTDEQINTWAEKYRVNLETIISEQF